VTIALTGSQYHIQAGSYRAVVTGLGAGLRSLSYDDTPLLATYDADELPPGAAGDLLAPWPNRIDGGAYTFEGASYQLALSEPAKSTAIHGLTRWANWALLSSTEAEVVLRHAAHGHQGYPFSVEFDAAFSLSAGDGLRVAITARNRGTRAAPYGNGFHPYLTVHAPVDSCELTLPVTQWLPLDDRGIPSGEPVPVDGTQYDFRSSRLIGSTVLDSAFTGLSFGDDGRAWAHLAGDGNRVSLWAGQGYRWLQVFTGDPLPPERRRRSVAIEPMTCPPNAFVSGEDLLILQPGDEVTHTWGVVYS
jgi:aldose 1-epimerase